MGDGYLIRHGSPPPPPTPFDAAAMYGPIRPRRVTLADVALAVGRRGAYQRSPSAAVAQAVVWGLVDDTIRELAALGLVVIEPPPSWARVKGSGS